MKKKFLVTLIVVILIIVVVAVYIVLNSKFKNNKVEENTNNQENVNTINEISDTLPDIQVGVQATQNSKYFDGKKTAIVPMGFTVSSKEEENKLDNGLVIIDADGNEFVWIPVDNFAEFIRQEGYYEGKLQSYLSSCVEADLVSKYATVESKSLYESISKNKGFYIARYEAGISENNSKYVIDGTQRPISKAGYNVWNEINWGSAYGYALDSIQGSDTKDGAVKVARSMYPNVENLKTYGLPTSLTNVTGVISTLCYGVTWDQTMRFMSNIKNEKVDNKYYIQDSTGMGWYSKLSKNEIHLTGENIDKLESNKVKNIYDMAGNVYEWTMESYSSKRRVVRGGEFETGDNYSSASIRGSNTPEVNFISYGFRVVLYIK